MRDLQSELLRSRQAFTKCSVWRLLEVFEDSIARYKYSIHLGLVNESLSLYLLTTSRKPDIPAYLLPEFLCVEAGQYEFWPQTTWIDCREIRQRKEVEFRALVRNDKDSYYCGQLENGHVLNIREIIAKSKFISPLYKNPALECLDT